jgi:hypothetical protein
MSHRVAVLEQVTNALRKTFDSDYPNLDFRVVYTGPEFQMEAQKYPAIYVAYQESQIRNAGLGHRIQAIDTEGMDRLLKQAIALGAIQFTAVALTPLERDALMDALSDILLFSKGGSAAKSTFWKEINDEDYLWLTLSTENIQPGGVSTMPAPWQSENDILFSGSYAVNTEAEFFSDFDTSDFVPINKVAVFPYRPDQQVPKI